MGADLRIRTGTAEDTDAILRLVRLSLGEGEIPREVEFWRWKHHENPFGPSPVLLAEAEDGELVGLRVFMRWEWMAGGTRARAVRAVDTATHPAWQGKGIFSRLTRALLEQVKADGVNFVFNTPNEKSRPGYLKMGWEAVGRTSPWIRPLRPLRLLRAIVGGTTGAAGEDGDRQTDAVAGTGAAGENFLSADGLCSLPDFPRLVEQASLERVADRRLTTPLSVEYLRWRYGRIPGIRYEALFDGDARASAAVVFRRKERGPLSEIRICELLVAGDRGSRIGRELVGRIRRRSGADYLSAMAASDTPERRILIRCGFLPAMRLGPILTVRPLNAVAGADPLKAQDWRYSAGEMELF